MQTRMKKISGCFIISLTNIEGFCLLTMNLRILNKLSLKLLCLWTHYVFSLLDYNFSLVFPRKLSGSLVLIVQDSVSSGWMSWYLSQFLQNVVDLPLTTLFTLHFIIKSLLDNNYSEDGNFLGSNTMISKQWLLIC